MAERNRDNGPHPLRRAIVGVLLGITLGALVALMLPRRPRDDSALLRGRVDT